MKYTKQQLDERYRHIHYLKTVKGLTYSEISRKMANCKKRTIQSAIKYVNETPSSDESLTNARIYQIEDDLHELYELREVIRERMKAAYAKDPVNNKEASDEMYTATDKLMRVIGKMERLRKELYALQNIYAIARKLHKPDYTHTQVSFTYRMVGIKEKEDGGYDVISVGELKMLGR